MTCQECQIELFEDAPGRDALVHAGECEDCRVVAREIQANSSALAALRGEEVAVRAFVYPSRISWPIWGVAAAAAVVLGIGLIRFYDRKVIVNSEVIVPTVVAQVEPPVPVPKITKRTQAVRVRPRAAAPLLEAEPPEPLLVKMLTADPDVVIYWLIEPDKGEAL